MIQRTKQLWRQCLACERLETRHLLTGGLSAVLDSAGVLRVTGTDAADFIFVYQNASRYYVYGSADSYSASSVREIVIDAKGGNDVVRLDSQIVSSWQAITTPQVTVYGGAGSDTVFGSEGKDLIFGGDGIDVLFGHGGHDYLDGGADTDYLYGNSGNDTLAGDTGNDILFGQEGADFLIGGDGNDYMLGGAGDDWLDGSRDYDWLLGEEGNDYLFDDLGTNYFVGGAGTNYNLAAHFGWFDMNLSDAQLRGAARSRYVDFVLDRSDMLSLFSNTSGDGQVSTNELSDLRKIVAQGGSLQMAESVRNLASKVVNTNTGNALYQGAALGNLAAGATGSQLNQLVNKWFLGLDRPNATIGATTFAYRQASGSLFVNGAELTDIRQGYVGDCYLLAGLAATALSTPNAIQQMFTDNGDGTFTVRFFNNGVADYVTVDRYLPTDTSGRLVFANLGSLASNAANELWTALAEKAYVQLNGSGWLRGSSGLNAYSSIAGGYVADAFKQITGRASSLGNALNLSALTSAIQSGQLVALASKFSGTVAAGVVKGHAYTVVGYDANSGNFTLFNPWGVNNGSAPAYLTMNITQLQSNFSYFDKTTA